MKLSKILAEALGGYSSSKSYPAASEPPRKDFGPSGKKDAYNYSRQSGDFPPATAVPPSPSSWPWELNNVIDDLSDASVYLEVAMKKMSNCAKGNKAISKKQKQALITLFRATKEASKVVTKVGMRIEDVANIAGQPTPDASVPMGEKPIKRN